VRHALVTGAAGAIGSAICRRLAEDGWGLLLVDLAPPDASAEHLRAEGAAVRTCVADLRTADGIDAVVAAAAETGDLGLLVNNAGIGRNVRATDLEETRFREVVAINLVAPLLLCERLAPMLADGAIVNISSRAAFGESAQADYVATKAGLIGATRSLALRLAPATRVNAVAPGLIATPRNELPADVLEPLVRRFPAQRPGRVEEVAEAVAFLAGASYVTGQVLAVCGGRSVGDALSAEPDGAVTARSTGAKGYDAHNRREISSG
jgi:3-oxoacyl-[acyl-carrier protein] reductase